MVLLGVVPVLLMLAACTQETADLQLILGRAAGSHASPGGADGAADMDAAAQPETPAVLSPAGTPARQSHRSSAAWTSRGLVPESLLVLAGTPGQPLQVLISLCHAAGMFASVASGFAIMVLSCCGQHPSVLPFPVVGVIRLRRLGRCLSAAEAAASCYTSSSSMQAACQQTLRQLPFVR